MNDFHYFMQYSTGRVGGVYSLVQDALEILTIGCFQLRFIPLLYVRVPAISGKVAKNTVLYKSM